MKPKYRKAMTATIMTLAIGAVTSSIVIPIVLSSSSVDPKVLNWNPDIGFVDDTTGTDFGDQISDEGQADRNLLTDFNFEISFKLYEEEQKGSLEFQKYFFDWEIYEKQIDIQDEIDKIIDEQYREDTDKKAELKAAFNNIERWLKDIDDINEKLGKLTDEIDSGDILEYDSSSFNSDYSKVLHPLDVIRKRREKVYKDAKNNFISQYDTSQEGENAWPAERQRQYGDSATDAEAIDYLTSQQISSNAFTQFTYKMNSEYNYEQKYAIKRELTLEKNTTNKDLKYNIESLELKDLGVAGTRVFPFLEKAQEKMETYSIVAGYDPEEDAEDNRKDEKVYFMSSNSKNPATFTLEEDANGKNNVIDEILDNQIIKVNHILYAAKQNASGPSLNWDVDKDTIKNLLTIYGRAADEKYVLDTIPDLFALGATDVDSKALDVQTELLIDHFGGDPSGVEKMGALGLNTMAGYVQQMSPGFGLALLNIADVSETISDGSANDGVMRLKDITGDQDMIDEMGERVSNLGVYKNYLATLTGKLQAAATSLFGWAGKAPSQDELEQALNNATDDEIKNNFGKAFRETFDDPATTDKGLKMWYPAGDGANVVVSEHGIHVVRITKYETKNTVQDEIDKDLLVVANKQDATKAQTSWDTMINNYFNGDDRTAFIMNNYNDHWGLKH